MEVHSPHTKQGSGWKHHLRESVMLFAAVTLGFFAENLREHYVERHRAVAYLDIIAADLDADIANIDTALELNGSRYAAANEAMSLFASGEYRQRMADFYYDVRLYPSRHMFVPAVNGIQQLRASGGIRLISNHKIMEAIQRYQISLERMAATQDLLERMLSDYRNKAAMVMDFRVHHSMYFDPTNTDRTKRWIKPTGNPDLLNQDPVHLNELMNMMLVSMVADNGRFIRLNDLKAEADALRRLIRAR